MANVSQTIIDDVLGRVDIVDVISSYIPLKAAGRNYKALCPFHHEKTSSFMVSRDKQIFHCFGCGAGGNALNFVMRLESLTFPEALEMMAKKAGVALPGFRPQEGSLNNRIYELNQLANSYFSGCLFSERGKAALNYLEKRGISPNAIKQFGIGFSSDSWDGLMSLLRDKNIPLSLIEKSGLIIAKNSGSGYYDRFRNRVTFPIHDVKGRICAFGGRILNEDKDSPKYLNSPETAVYVKGKHLFGLYFSKEGIRANDYAAIVEGYLDFLTPFVNGFTPIVASLGTALTAEQVHLLKRYTGNLVMIYDADQAGEMATLRGLDLCVEEDVNVKIVSLKKGFDPDLFVREKGIAAFEETVKNAVPLFDYKFSMLCRRHNPAIIEDRAKIAREMLLTIGKFKNEIVKSEYIKRLADELKVREDSLRMESARIQGKEKKTGFSGFEYHRQGQEASALEKMLLCVMMDIPGLVSKFREVLSPDDLQDKGLASLAAVLLKLIDAPDDEALSVRLMNHCCDDDSLSRVVAELSALAVNGISEDREKIFNDCVSRIKALRIKNRCALLKNEIKQAEILKDDSKSVQLIGELNELIKKGGINEKSKQ